MSKKRNGVNWAKSPAHKQRRQGAIERFEVQLENGTKNNKDGKPVPLTDKDVKRINKELTILKQRI